MIKAVIKKNQVEIYKDGHYVLTIFHDEESMVIPTPDYSFIAFDGYSRIYPDEIVDEREVTEQVASAGEQKEGVDVNRM